MSEVYIFGELTGDKVPSFCWPPKCKVRFVVTIEGNLVRGQYRLETNPLDLLVPEWKDFGDPGTSNWMKKALLKDLTAMNALNYPEEHGLAFSTQFPDWMWEVPK